LRFSAHRGAAVRYPAVVTSPPHPLCVLIPVYDDWEPARAVVQELDRVLAGVGVGGARLVIVDDASPTTVPADWLASPLAAFADVECLRLRNNLGHQRAIAIGLAFIEAERPSAAVVIQDSDGEDRPLDVPRLLDAFAAKGGREAVFAERTRRSERLSFRVLYRLYKAFHWLVTGVRVRVGNFSVLPRSAVERLVTNPELWSHYAATVIASRVPHTMIPTDRGVRIAGRSKMTFVKLVVHGLVAISVYADVVGVRLVGACALAFGAALAAAGGVALANGVSGAPWSGGALIATGLIGVVLLQTVLFAILFTFVMLVLRNNLSFVPRRDYRLFVADVTRVGGGTGAA